VGDDAAFVVHQLRDERGFAAGRGAEIEDDFAGARIEFAHRQQRARVLDVKPTLLKTFERGERRMRFQLEHQTIASPIAADEIILHALIPPEREESPISPDFFRHAAPDAVRPLQRRFAEVQAC
jgi:hypothetical protein